MVTVNIMTIINAAEMSIYKWLKWQSLYYVYLTTSKEKEQQRKSDDEMLPQLSDSGTWKLSFPLCHLVRG